MKVGIVGLGTTGLVIAHALQYFGSDLYYYSRTRKPEEEANVRGNRKKPKSKPSKKGAKNKGEDGKDASGASAPGIMTGR